MKKKESKIFYVLMILIFFFGIESIINAKSWPQKENQAPGTGTAEMSLAELDELMKEKTVENCNKAIKGYEVLLRKEPNNYELLYKIAEAYTSILDIKTSTLIVEKDEYKPLLKKYGTIANDYAKQAYKLKPDKKEVVSACLVSYGYLSASYGILKAIFKGAAGHYKKLCKQLIKLDDKYNGALGYRMMGKLNHVAPWPVGTTGRALKYFKKAVETDNSILYSHYYLGLIYFDKDKYDLAKKEFTFVVETPPTEHEKHFIAAYKKEARQYLKKISKIEQKKK